jgi:hypothetical protein
MFTEGSGGKSATESDGGKGVGNLNDLPDLVEEGIDTGSAGRDGGKGERGIEGERRGMEKRALKEGFNRQEETILQRT